MAQAINDVCRYTEAYFKRIPAEKRNSATVKQFEHHLSLAEKVVETHIDAAQHPDFYDGAEMVLAKSTQTIEGLAETIVSSIRQRSNERLMDYEVNARILDAQKYRNPKSQR